MSVISSKHKAFKNRIRTLTNDSGIIRLCDEYSRDAERTDAVLRERQRQVEAILTESRLNAQKCSDYETEIDRYRAADIGQRREIESLKAANRDFKIKNEEWAGIYASLQGEYDKIIREIIELEKIREEQDGQIVLLAASCKELQEECAKARQENVELQTKLMKLRQMIGIGNRERFDTDSERTSSLFGWDGRVEDPLDEGAPFEGGEEGMTGDGDNGGSYSAESAFRDIEKKLGETEDDEDGSRESGRKDSNDNGKADGQEGGKKGKEEDQKGRKSGTGKKNAEERKKMLEDMRNVFFFDYDFDVLNEIYGEGCYEIIGFERHWEIRETRPVDYVYNHYRPIIKITRGRGKGTLFREEFAFILYPRSPVSPSLLAGIIYKRFCLALPLYRQEQDYMSRNIPISRQSMSNWIIHFAYEVFTVAYERMREELDRTAVVRQCDETTWKVIVWSEESGKRNASKGYLWVHTTGELSEGHQVVLYVFEESRSADHLREYLANLSMILVSDAYGAYFAIEKESGGKITVSCC